MFGCLGILACSLCFMALKGIKNCVVCVLVKCLILDGSWMKNIQIAIMLDMGLPGSAYIFYKGFLDSMGSEVAITCWFHLTCLSSIRNCWLSKHVAFSLCDDLMLWKWFWLLVLKLACLLICSLVDRTHSRDCWTKEMELELSGSIPLLWLALTFLLCWHKCWIFRQVIDIWI